MKEIKIDHIELSHWPNGSVYGYTLTTDNISYGQWFMTQWSMATPYEEAETIHINLAWDKFVLLSQKSQPWQP